MSAVMTAVNDPRQRVRQVVPETEPPRLRQEGVADASRNCAIAMHLAPLGVVLGFFPLAFLPLVLWLVRKERSSFDDDHGREVVNMELTALVFSAIAGIGSFLTFGLAAVFFVVWSVFIIVSMIRAAIASSNGEYFRYPMVIRFLS
jgi:uncharacterized Tic20 family protein